MEPIRVVLQGVINATRTSMGRDSSEYEVSALVPAEEMAKLSRVFANPRLGNSENPEARVVSSVVKDIRETLVQNPEDFHKHNLGITVIADAAKLDAHGTEGTLAIIYNDTQFLREYATDSGSTQQIRGVANGGTTLGTIVEAIADEVYPSENGRAYVRLNVRVGPYSRDEVSALVETLNNNKQLDNYSKANFVGSFKDAKRILENAEINGQYFPSVAYFYGDAGQYTIQELIQLLVLFARRDSDGDPCPRDAYSGTANALEYFLSEEGNRQCKKYLPLLPSIVKLSEYIQSRLPDRYNNKTGRKFFGLKLFSALKKPSKTPFMHYDATVARSNGWLFPILSAFDAMIDCSGSQARWTAEPEKAFDAVAAKMTKLINKHFLDYCKNQRSLGGHTPTYESLRNIVDGYTQRGSR